jgi:hypothetical protein
VAASRVSKNLQSDGVEGEDWRHDCEKWPETGQGHLSHAVEL